MQLNRRLFAGAVGLAIVFGTALLDAQVVESDLRGTVFYEPSPTSRLTVITPAIDVGVRPASWLDLRVAYEADVVSGATEAVKAGPLVDIVSGATEFKDTRHVVRGGVGLTGENTRFGAEYSYGTESDYRSQAFSVSAGTDFFQKNTQIDLSYARGFDRVCTSAYTPSTDESARLRMESSEGCFTDSAERASRPVDLDTLQAAWTQAWTPVLATQLVLTGSLQHGFLENPYRGVVVAPAGQDALENHPDDRARGAVSVRGKYFVKPLLGTLGAGFRLYRDTWDIVAQTYEIEAEKYVTSGIRVLGHFRYYTQKGALFYSNDYTGGEPVSGPRGRYWTGDRELSPLSSWLVGGRVLVGAKGTPDARILGILLGFQTTASLDLLKTSLDDFTWGTAEPDDTTAAMLSLSVRGEF